MEKESTELLRELSEKLGTTVEHLWSVLLKQVPVEIFNNILWTLLGVLFIYLLIKICIKIHKKGWLSTDYSNDYDIAGQLIVGFSGVLCIIFIITTIINLIELPTLIFNPEYWALKEILGTIK